MLKDPLKVERLPREMVSIPLEWLRGLVMTSERCKQRLDWVIQSPTIKRGELEVLEQSEISYLLGYIESINDYVYKEQKEE